MLVGSLALERLGVGVLRRSDFTQRRAAFFDDTTPAPRTRSWFPRKARVKACGRDSVQESSKTVRPQFGGLSSCVAFEHSDNRWNVVSVTRTLRDTLSRHFVGGFGGRMQAEQKSRYRCLCGRTVEGSKQCRNCSRGVMRCQRCGTLNLRAKCLSCELQDERDRKFGRTPKANRSSK